MPVSAARVLRAIAGEEQTDAELLGRFLDRGDEAAFAALVRDHGAMVYGACWRLLPTDQDAEDAFQATFLVLAEKARAAAPREVANWLYGVARRVSLFSRRSIVRQRGAATIFAGGSCVNGTAAAGPTTSRAVEAAPVAVVGLVEFRAADGRVGPKPATRTRKLTATAAAEVVRTLRRERTVEAVLTVVFLSEGIRAGVAAGDDLWPGSAPSYHPPSGCNLQPLGAVRYIG